MCLDWLCKILSLSAFSHPKTTCSSSRNLYAHWLHKVQLNAGRCSSEKPILGKCETKNLQTRFRDIYSEYSTVIYESRSCSLRRKAYLHFHIPPPRWCITGYGSKFHHCFSIVYLPARHTPHTSLIGRKLKGLQGYERRIVCSAAGWPALVCAQNQSLNLD